MLKYGGIEIILAIIFFPILVAIVRNQVCLHNEPENYGEQNTEPRNSAE